MREALEIIHRLLAGEKLDFEGTYLPVPEGEALQPAHSTTCPIWMAAGGEQSATFAGKNIEGLIVSVKDPGRGHRNRSSSPFRTLARPRVR